MEMFELRYFLAAARRENLQQAAVDSHVSAGSISKAIARLESELGINLFVREGRHVRLTEQGRLLQHRAAEIIRLEEAARVEVGGKEQILHVRITGLEILLARFGIEVAKEIRIQHPLTHFEFVPASDDAAMESLQRGEAHLALLTIPAPTGMRVREIAQTVFQTCVGPGHPLFAAAKARREVSIEAVLEQDFVSTQAGILGKLDEKQSTDGWRDDRLPRRISFVCPSLKVLEGIVSSGLALAHLPDYMIASLGLRDLRVVGCPYVCRQRIRMVAHRPDQALWLSRLF